MSDEERKADRRAFFCSIHADTKTDWRVVSSQEHARKHGTTVEKVKAIISQTKSRSRREIEEALDQHFQHHPTETDKENAE